MLLQRNTGRSLRRPRASNTPNGSASKPLPAVSNRVRVSPPQWRVPTGRRPSPPASNHNPSGAMAIQSGGNARRQPAPLGAVSVNTTSTTQVEIQSRGLQR